MNKKLRHVFGADKRLMIDNSLDSDRQLEVSMHRSTELLITKLTEEDARELIATLDNLFEINRV